MYPGLERYHINLQLVLHHLLPPHLNTHTAIIAA